MQIGETIQFGPYIWQILDIKENMALLITRDIIGGVRFSQ